MKKREENLIGYQTYSFKGDTAMIHIEDFMAEYTNKDEWLKYYQGKRDTIPYSATEGSSVAGLYKWLEKTHNDSNIKNVIIDLSSNSGGSTDELIYLIFLLTDNNTIYYKNQITNQLVSVTYEIDRNLDRQFNELDDTYDAVGNLNIYVISSNAGFSCSGISPIYLHNLGIPVIGDNCGGGSCAVYYRTDGLGCFTTFAFPI